MGDVTVTAADVRPLPGAVVKRYDAGGSGSVGDSVYIAADGDVEKADADGGTVLPFSKGVVVSVVNGATDGATTFASGDTVEVCRHGPVTGFSSLTPGDVLYQSDTAGKLSDEVGTVDHRVATVENTTTIWVNPDLKGSN